MMQLGNRHPDVHTPWKQWSEDQKLYLAVVYSNPFRWETRRRLFNDFLDHISTMPNIVPYVGELAYGARPFEVTDENNPHHIQMRTSHELWHKENLIDLVTSCFPVHAQYLGYADGDFVFTRKDLGLEAIHLLQHHEFVQLFSSYTPVSHWHRPTRVSSSFAWNYLHRREVYKGHGYPISAGAPGGAWCYRRSAYDAVGGMMDHCILGSGDLYMAQALIGSFDAKKELGAGYTRAYIRMIERWQDRAKVLTKNIGCVDCHAVHHFHGSYKYRGYGDRWHILRKHHFDPDEDVSYDSQGILRLNGNKPALRDDIRAYFLSRNEDSPELHGEKHIV